MNRNALLLLALLPFFACAAPNCSNEADTTDAWLKGKVEMALLLNPYLNSFKIATNVENRNVTLTGIVASNIDRDLAGQIVLGIDGIATIDNQIDVDPDEAATRRPRSETGSLQHIRDVTLTARIKSRLVLNNNIHGRDIDVDTHDSVVTLRGNVRSAHESELATQIAQGTENVKSVDNRLKVIPTT